MPTFTDKVIGHRKLLADKVWTDSLGEVQAHEDVLIILLITYLLQPMITVPEQGYNALASSSTINTDELPQILGIQSLG